MESLSIKENILNVYLNLKNSKKALGAESFLIANKFNDESPFALFLSFVKKYLKYAGMGDVDPVDFLLANGERFPSLLAKFLERYEKSKPDECQEFVDYVKYIASPDALKQVRETGHDTESFDFWKQQTSTYLLRTYTKYDELDKISSFRKSKHTESRYDFFSKKELVSYFSVDKLEQLGEEGIIELSQALANAYAKEHNVAPAKIEAVDFDDPQGKITYGAYYASNNKIGVNSQVLRQLATNGNPYLVAKYLQTIFHEAHHGIQFNNIGKILASDSGDGVVADLLQITSAKDQSSLSYQEYLWQIEELDARYNALKELNIAQNAGYLSADCASVLQQLNAQEKAKNRGSAHGVWAQINQIAQSTPLNQSMENILAQRKLSAYTDPNSEQHKQLMHLLNNFEEIPFVEQ